MGGGAWPFLVGGVICQVNSDNERDFSGRDVSDLSDEGEMVISDG